MPSDGSRRPTRRRILRAGCGVATGLVAGLSGCSGQSGDGEGDGGDTTGTAGDGGPGPTATPTGTATPTPTETAADTPTRTPVVETPAGPGDGSYTRWLPAPGTATDRRHYGFVVFDVSGLRKNAEDLGNSYTLIRGSYRRPLLRLGLRWRQAGGILIVAPEGTSDGSTAVSTTVVTGSFDADQVSPTDIRDVEYTAAGEYEGYALYERQEAAPTDDVVLGGTLAVADGAVVAGTNRRPTAAVRATIDARRGAVDRYVEASENFRRLTDVLGTGTLLRGRTTERYETTDPGRRPQFAGQVATGRAIAVDGATSRLRIPVVFASADDADVGAVRSWAERRREAGGVLSTAEEVTVTVTPGGVVLVRATVPSDSILSAGGRLRA